MEERKILFIALASHFSLGRCWMGRLSFNKIFLEENEKKKSPKKGIEKNIGTENVSMLYYFDNITQQDFFLNVI